jgi:GNAT superfamily N-acetyltransferase
MSVRTVESPRDLRHFIDLPYRLHRDDAMWAPPFKAEVRDLLSRAKNPFFEHAEASYFLAERSGRTVGRIAAIANHLHNEVHADAVAFFGFFECENDPGLARELFAAAEEWALERKFVILRGPASFSVNDECGLLIDGFDHPAPLMMPHNPPYYRDLIEAAGFGKAKDLFGFWGGHPTRYEPVPERLTRAIEVMRKRQGITIRSFRKDRFDDEVQKIKDLYNASWERNWGFVPMTDAEIDHLAARFKPILIPEIVPFAEKDGEVVGFGVALPDLNQVLMSNRSGHLLPAVLKLLWALKTKRIRRARIPLLGVLPQFRGKGIDSMLYHRIWTAAAERGIYWGDASWTLEDNHAINRGLEKMGFRHYQTYRVYEKALAG